MRGDFNTEADALEIDLLRSRRADATDIVDDSYCHVATLGGEAVTISLAAPDHLVEVSIGKSLAA